MNLGYATMHTATVYMHRFYMYHSFKTFPRFVTACSCLFLAGKVVSSFSKIQLDYNYLVDVFNLIPGRDSEKVSGYHSEGRTHSVKSEVCIVRTRSEGGGNHYGENTTENNQV